MNSELPVWRQEFQLRREVLHQLGIRSFAGLMQSLGGVWGYASQDWLRLAVPQTGDNNRGRWPTHPMWTQLSEIRWRLDDVPLVRKYSPARVPSQDKLFRLDMAIQTSFMAIHGIAHYREGVQAFQEQCEAFHRNRCDEQLKVALEDWVELQVRTKGRLYNSVRNVPSLREESETLDEVDADAIEYTKQSRGE